jgi:hypothetical protein
LSDCFESDVKKDPTSPHDRRYQYNAIKRQNVLRVGILSRERDCLTDSLWTYT